jgi:hypothetical protein
LLRAAAARVSANPERLDEELAALADRLDDVGEDAPDIRDQVGSLFTELAGQHRDDGILELTRAFNASNTEMALMLAQFRDVLAALTAPKEIITDGDGKPVGVNSQCFAGRPRPGRGDAHD